MIKPFAFARYIIDQALAKRVLARVYLNSLYDREIYPVDLSEVDGLGSVDRCMAYGFLDGLFIDPSLERVHARDHGTDETANEWLKTMRQLSDVREIGHAATDMDFRSPESTEDACSAQES